MKNVGETGRDEPSNEIIPLTPNPEPIVPSDEETTERLRKYIEEKKKTPNAPARLTNEEIEEKMEEMREENRIAAQEREKAIRETAKETITEIHKYNPRYIFLCECLSTPAGYMIKEALRMAYPDDPLPIFYRIDPRQVTKVMEAGQRILQGKAKPEDEEYLAEKKEELENFMKKRVKDKDENILVYDQDWASGYSPASIVGLFKNPEKFGFNADIENPNVKMNLSEGHGNELKQKQHWELNLDVDEADILPIPPIPVGMYEYVTTKKDKRGGYNFRGRIIDNPEKTKGLPKLKGALKLIKAYKKIGAEIGREVRADLEKPIE